MSYRILPLFAAAALGVAGAGSAAAVHAQIVPTPRAAPLAVTPASRPFLGAASTAQPLDLASRGYVENEFVVSGTANAYDWNAAGAGVVARGMPVPYATRLLVRQPAPGRRFSGLVVLELLDPTPLHDTSPVFSLAQEELLRAGHVWVGVTVKPVAIAALQTVDAGRYGKLSFAYPQSPECRPAAPLPGVPGSDSNVLAAPGSENGLAYDAIAQAGALLRSGSRENPLVALEPRRIVAAGFGEAAGMLVTFLNARATTLRLGDGSPIFDAYLPIAGGIVEAPINQCAAPLAADDARRQIGPRDAAVFNVMTQTEVPRALPQRRADSDDPKDFYRLYEVAGAAHSAPTGSARPGLRDLGLLGVSGSMDDPCEEPQADFPLGLAVNGVVAQIEQWLFKGTLPSKAARLSVDDDGQVARDASGNAIGGLRLPVIELPYATYSARSTPRRSDDAGNVWRCSLTGHLRRFDSAEMKQRYGSRTEYLRRFNAAVDQAVADRVLVAADAAALKASQARVAPMF